MTAVLSAFCPEKGTSSQTRLPVYVARVFAVEVHGRVDSPSFAVCDSLADDVLGCFHFLCREGRHSAEYSILCKRPSLSKLVRRGRAGGRSNPPIQLARTPNRKNSISSNHSRTRSNRIAISLTYSSSCSTRTAIAAMSDSQISAPAAAAAAAPVVRESNGNGPAPLALRAIVKSIQSGDTLVLKGRAAPAPGQAPKERVLHLAHLQAPRPGSRDRADEVYSLEARDFLRTMLVGKEVSFEIVYTVPSNASTGSPQMEFGDVVLQRPDGTSVDVALAVVAAGASKVRESRNVEQEGASEQTRKQTLREAEESARAHGEGLWQDDLKRPHVNFSMPDDPDAFLAEHGKGKKLDAVVEGINNGTTVRVRLQVGPGAYQIVNVA